MLAVFSLSVIVCHGQLQQQALLDLYSATGGASWHTTWDTTVTTYSTWFGVFVSSSTAVTRMYGKRSVTFLQSNSS